MTQRSVWGRLYHGETDIDFIGRTKLWFAISGVVILIGMVSLFTRGLNLGIDFKGGTAWEVPSHGKSVAAARSAVESAGLNDPQVQTLRSGNSVRLRIQAKPQTQAAQAKVTTALAKLTGESENNVSITDVGPSWGNEISKKAVRALVVFLVVIALYITLRFEWKMALATLAALVHDILITVGIYSVFGFPVTPATVIAVLTILGYSIYDGIVVFDKVDENVKLLTGGGKITYAGMVNLSLNEVLMRTLNTSITALLPILSLLVIGSLVLGATTLQEFALALFIGLASGAYSSIFIASPSLVLLKQREPRYASLRTRVAEGRGPLAPSGAKAAAMAEDAPARRLRPSRGGGDGTGRLAVEDAIEEELESADEAMAAVPARPNRPNRPNPKGGSTSKRPAVQPKGRKKGRRR